MMVEAEKPLKTFEKSVMNNKGNKQDLLIVKYYIKMLILYNEHQLGTEAKDGYH